MDKRLSNRINLSKILKRLIIFTIAGVFASAILYVLYLEGFFLPDWINWKTENLIIDGQLEARLINKSVTLYENNKDIWRINNSIKVSDVICDDIDGNGNIELVVLCWKIGKYGKHLPFWETNDKTWSQHIFIYEIVDNTVRQKWMTSDTGIIINRIKIDNHEIIVESKDLEVTTWKWDSFGLKIVDTDVDILAVGDNLIHETIFIRSLTGNDNYEDLYANIKKEICLADLAIVNQETPLVDKVSDYSDYPDFGTPEAVGDALVDAGFDVFTCATNHFADKGIEGINNTVKFCRENKVIPLGIKSENETTIKPYTIIEVKGVKIAMLNYTYGTNLHYINQEYPDSISYLKDEEKIAGDINLASNDSDFVFVFVHWGEEYHQNISDEQEHWAKVFSEAGADVVVGTHPHVLQKTQIIDGKDNHKTYIYYSLGNFMSAQTKIDRIVGGMALIKIGRTFDGVEIKDYSMQGLVTHQSFDGYSVYKLEEYPSWLAKTHRLGITKEELVNIFNDSLK